MEDPGTFPEIERHGRVIYRVSLSLDNPIDNQIHDFIEQYGKSNVSGNIKRMLMGFIYWESIIKCTQPSKGTASKDGFGHSCQDSDKPSSSNKGIAKKIFGY
jgi:hypothetical protein